MNISDLNELLLIKDFLFRDFLLILLNLLIKK